MKIMPKRALLLVALLLVFAVQSHANDFTYDGLTYTILPGHTCQTKAGYSNATSTGWETGAGNSVSGNLVIPEVVYYNNVAYTVTSIGSYAFATCSGLKEVTIPNSVTSLGNSAFLSCSGLTKVTIGNSVTSIGDSEFSGCIRLTEVSIPNSVTSIANFAFRNCTSLTEVTIPNSVTTIGVVIAHE
jgi:hypothetical protein